MHGLLKTNWLHVRGLYLTRAKQAGQEGAGRLELPVLHTFSDRNRRAGTRIRRGRGVAVNRIGPFHRPARNSAGRTTPSTIKSLSAPTQPPPAENPNDGKTSESHAGARPQNWGDSAVFRRSSGVIRASAGEQARSAPIGGGLRLQRRDLGTPASERTSRTRSA